MGRLDAALEFAKRRMRRARGEVDPSVPVQVYPEEDDRSVLVPQAGGYTPDEAQEEFAALDAPEAPGRVYPPTPGAPDEPLPANLQALVSGMGGVADRAQAAIQGPAARPSEGVTAEMGPVAEVSRTPRAVSPSQTSPPAVAAKAMMSAGPRKPLQAPPPQQAGPDLGPSPEEQERIRQFARERAQKLGLFDSLGEHLSSSTDLITGTRAPAISTRSFAVEGQRGVDAAEEQIRAAQEFASRRLGLQRQTQMDARADAESAERKRQFDASQKSRADELAARQSFEGTEAEKERAFKARQNALERAAAARRAEQAAHSGHNAMGQVKRDLDFDKNTEDLSKRLENVPAMKADLTTLLKFAGQDDIPGVGPLAGRAPGFMLSDDGIRVRQSARGIVGALIKEQSGSAASEQEVNRKLEELGMGSGATEAEFKAGVKRLIGNLRETVRGKEAGYEPRVVQTVRERGGVTSADLPSVPTLDSQAPRPPPFPGAIRVRGPNGKLGWWDGQGEPPGEVVR